MLRYTPTGTYLMAQQAERTDMAQSHHSYSKTHARQQCAIPFCFLLHEIINHHFTFPFSYHNQLPKVRERKGSHYSRTSFFATMIV